MSFGKHLKQEQFGLVLDCFFRSSALSSKCFPRELTNVIYKFYFAYYTSFSEKYCGQGFEISPLNKLCVIAEKVGMMGESVRVNDPIPNNIITTIKFKWELDNPRFYFTGLTSNCEKYQKYKKSSKSLGDRNHALFFFFSIFV